MEKIVRVITSDFVQQVVEIIDNWSVSKSLEERYLKENNFGIEEKTWQVPIITWQKNLEKFLKSRS